MSQSIRYQIAAAFVAALRADPALAGATVKHNPRDPAPLRDGERVVFVEDQSDALIDTANQQSKRIFVFALGVINRGSDAEADADADYVAAEAALRAAYVSVAAMLREQGAGVGALAERQVAYTVDDLDVDGALIFGTYEITYLKPKQPR